MQQYETIVIDVTTCESCGIQFGASKAWMDARRADGKGFYCPNGHALAFEGTTKKLKKELEEAKKAAADAKRQADQYRNWYNAEQGDHEQTRKKLSSTKGQLTKTKKRVANGVCPCCSRHFANLERHMAGQHPDFAHEHGD